LLQKRYDEALAHARSAGAQIDIVYNTTHEGTLRSFTLQFLHAKDLEKFEADGGISYSKVFDHIAEFARTIDALDDRVQALIKLEEVVRVYAPLQPKNGFETSESGVLEQMVPSKREELEAFVEQMEVVLKNAQQMRHRKDFPGGDPIDWDLIA